MIQIDTKTFFRVGIGCFLVIGITGLLNFIMGFAYYNWIARIGTMAQIFFNFVTAAFFLYLYRSSQVSYSEGSSQLAEELRSEIDGLK